jgi:predicted ATPase
LYKEFHQVPFLSSIQFFDKGQDRSEYPFSIPSLQSLNSLKFTKNITFFVGENGSGKSTLLEAIANKCNFNLQGGNRNHMYNVEESQLPLAQIMRLGWSVKTAYGFFMRAESYFNFATYIDDMAKEFSRTLDPYGGKPLHEQSHGESFLSLFTHKFDDGLFLLDEPEAALSPQRQLAFLSIIKELDNLGTAQFIIATHSPILLCYPNATILNFDDGLKEIKCEETEHFKLTKNFINNPETYLRHL